MAVEFLGFVVVVENSLPPPSLDLLLKFHDAKWSGLLTNSRNVYVLFLNITVNFNFFEVLVGLMWTRVYLWC